MTLVSIVDSNGTAGYTAGIETLLKSVDNEFTPPLSERSGGARSNHLKTGTHVGIEPYLRSLDIQQNLVAIRSDSTGAEVIGLLSYRSLGRDEYGVIAGTTYVSTFAVKRTLRRTGLGTWLYAMYIGRASGRSPGCGVLTRTWSTNERYMSLLHRLGFLESRRLRDDRGYGIDTIYYLRPPEPVNDFETLEFSI